MVSPVENPRRWRFTWETLGHVPTLRLYLFNGETNPALQCKNFKSSLSLESSVLVLSWQEEIHSEAVDFAVRIPVPRVLIDPNSPVDVRAKEDHVEVKLAMILPVDHPLVSNFDSFFDVGNDDSCQDRVAVNSNRRLPLSQCPDLRSLCSEGGIDFFCKSCSTKLTKEPLRKFVEMPSANWREVADNWFGACCCSFGGASEKLVSAFADNYSCTQGTCLLDDTSVIVSKDDFLGNIFPISEDNKVNLISEAVTNLGFHVENSAKILGNEAVQGVGSINNLTFTSLISPADAPSPNRYDCCISHTHRKSSDSDSLTSSNNQPSSWTNKVQRNDQKFKVGPLGNGFMICTSHLSSDIEWIEFMCSKCSSLLGSFPSCKKGSDPADGGVRLFKWRISTCTPSDDAGNLFRDCTLQRVFANWLLESAKDELSFRTLVKDLRTKSPMLQIVLLNPKMWCCTGFCLDSKSGEEESVPSINLLPVVKVLFSDCSLCSKPEARKVEEWATRNQANEVCMMPCQVAALIEGLKQANEILPFSCSLMQGLALSTVER